MPEFRAGQPVVTNTPDVEVTVAANAPLSAGRHRFQLVVEDDSGNSSEPSITDVIVRDTQKPTAVIDAPREVELGRSFQLSGRRSTDVGGRIVKYTWTRLD